MMTISKNINRLMGERHWTPERLAANLQDRGNKVFIGTINGWLSGRCNPKAENIIALAEIFETSTDAILRGPSMQEAS